MKWEWHVTHLATGATGALATLYALLQPTLKNCSSTKQWCQADTVSLPGLLVQAPHRKRCTNALSPDQRS